MESANGGHYHLQRNERRNHSLSLENKNWIENVIQLVSTVALTQLPVRKHNSVSQLWTKKKKKKKTLNRSAYYYHMELNVSTNETVLSLDANHPIIRFSIFRRFHEGNLCDSSNFGLTKS